MKNLEKIYPKRNKLSSVNRIVRFMSICNLNIQHRDINSYRTKNIVSNYPKELTMIEDLIKYSLPDNENDCELDKLLPLSKSIIKSIEKIDLDFIDYMFIKMELNNLTGMSAFGQQHIGYKVDTEYLCFMYYMFNVIDIVKFRTDMYTISGYDEATDRLLRIKEDKLFDDFNVVFRSRRDTEQFVKTVKIVTESLRTSPSFKNEPEHILMASANDKVDDLIRVTNEQKVLLGTLRLSTGLELPSIVSTPIEVCSKVSFPFVKKELIEKRNKITSAKGTLLVTYKSKRLESILLKDIIVYNKYPCIIGVVRFRDGSENSFVIPTRFSTMQPSMDGEILSVIYKFYGIEEGVIEDDYFDIIDSHYWKFRSNNYIGSNDKYVKGNLVREFKEVPIGAFMRKAENASEDAVKLAKSYGITLPKGYTFVREHKRTYGKSNL